MIVRLVLAILVTIMIQYHGDNHDDDGADDNKTIMIPDGKQRGFQHGWLLQNHDNKSLTLPIVEVITPVIQVTLK